MESKWICTDPDTNQWGRKIGERIYEFKQDMKYPKWYDCQRGRGDKS